MRRINKKAILSRLDAIEKNMKHSQGAKCISLEEWLNSDDNSKSFYEYVKRFIVAHEVILTDDMCIGSDMYIDTSIVLTCSKEDIRHFAELVNDPVEYMKKYIKAFNDFFNIKEVKPKEYYMQTKELSFLDGEKVIAKGGRYLTPEECREKHYEYVKRDYEQTIQTLLDIFKERGAAFYLDFLEHYTVMTVEELVNRYQQIEMHKLLQKQLENAQENNR